MAKKSLLEIVQEIANDIDTDEINTIGDTIESRQIAAIVESTYYAIISNRNWPHTAGLIRVDSSADINLPNVMYIADEFKEIISVYYNKIKAGETKLKFQEVVYVKPDDMLRIFYGRNSDADNVEVVSFQGQTFVVLNNQAPQYFTSFDDKTLVFDSYDKGVDTTLMSSKTQVRAYLEPKFELNDDFIPDLPSEAFTFLIEEAKSKCAAKIAQKADQKSEQESRRQNQWLSRKAWRVAGGIEYQRFGRGRFGTRYREEPTFKQEKSENI